MIQVRPGEERDIPQIRDTFLAVYGNDYPYKEFYDVHWLKRSLFSDNVILLVAEDTETGRVAGTASVILEIGAYSDLVGEFGRLAVHPDFRQRRIGHFLMQKRVEAIQDRLHLGLVMARVVHRYSQQIAQSHEFVPLGFLPLAYCFSYRESFALLGRFFGDALALRKNNPRIIPEAYPLANLILSQASLPLDVIVDEESAPYPYHEGFELKEMTVEGYSALLRIERGRVRNREIFGHMRLEYGFFKLQAKKATYLLAYEKNQLVGAVGFTLNPIEHSVRVFELITFTDHAIRFLLSELERKCREDWDVQFIEIDVSAHSPRMQRTLLELNFLPAAYIPAMVFHEVERLDIMRMVRLTKLQDLGPVDFVPSMKEVVDIVMKGFLERAVTPTIAEAVSELPLFRGMTKEQGTRVARACTISEYESGQQIFHEADIADRMYIVLDGTVGVTVGNPGVKVGRVGKWETLGELSFLSVSEHSATAIADDKVKVAVLTHQELGKLVRCRPDIGVIIYQNLGVGLGKKLLRSDHSLRQQLLDN